MEKILQLFRSLKNKVRGLAPDSVLYIDKAESADECQVCSPQAHEETQTHAFRALSQHKGYIGFGKSRKS
jgi:hypothetical protein